MFEQNIDMPCPMCGLKGQFMMITHIDEIPYFGEHTQLTLLCHSCGWRQTDFIPPEGKNPGCLSLVLDSKEKLNTRVVRSSSCSIQIPELDLLVNPGSNSTGYVSNVEGVLQRFLDVIDLVSHDLLGNPEVEEPDESLQQITHMKHHLQNIGNADSMAITLEFLDPHGLSTILHDEVQHRLLTDEELAVLPVGPDPAVFSQSDVNHGE
jgi:zinc finger protein